MSFLEQCNSVQYACFARLSLVTLSPANLRLRIHSSRHREGETLENFIKRNRSDIVIERQTLQGLRTTVNLSQRDAAPLGLQMFLVSGSSGREPQKLGVSAKAR